MIAKENDLFKINTAIDRIKDKIKEVTKKHEFPIEYTDREGNKKIFMSIEDEIGNQIIGLEEALEILERIKGGSIDGSRND